MVELTLPKNSRMVTGKTWPKPEGATNVRTFRIYRYDPDSGAQPADRHLFRRPRHLRPDGSRRADQDQERDRPDADLPPLLPRGHLRLLRDEHRRHQHARLHLRHGRDQGRREDLPAAAHAGGQGPRARPHPLLRPARQRQAVARDRDQPARSGSGSSRSRTAASSTGSTSASSAPAARPPARATGGTATASSARRRCCTPIAGSSTAATRRPASGSTSSRIRSSSTAATPS